MNTLHYQLVQGRRSKDLQQRLELVCSCPSSCWCGNPWRFALHSVQVLFGPHGLSSVFGTSQYRYDNMAQKKKEVAAIYKSLAVCNIATRSCCLLEFHFRTVGFVLQTVSLEEDTLVRHIHKYKFNMWSDQIHIAYLILWIRPVFNEGCPVFICNIFHWRCLGDFIVSLAFKVRFSKVVPIPSQSRLKNMSACLFSYIIFQIQLEPHLLKKNVSLIRRKLESMGQS